MKGLRIGFIVFAAGLITFGLSGMAFAFHSGGVAECMGCHNIHDAKSTSALLINTDISSTCISCHGASGASSYHIATPDADMPAGTPPLNRVPGGDFGWLKKTYSYSPRSGSTTTEAGDRHGHNIVAADFGYAADATNATAPGGDMDSTLFSCNSCHDNHGKLRRLSDGTFATTGAPIIASGSYNTSPVPAAGQAVGAYRILRGTGLLCRKWRKDLLAPISMPLSRPRTTVPRRSLLPVSPTARGYPIGAPPVTRICIPQHLQK